MRISNTFFSVLLVVVSVYLSSCTKADVTIYVENNSSVTVEVKYNDITKVLGPGGSTTFETSQWLLPDLYPEADVYYRKLGESAWKTKKLSGGSRTGDSRLCFIITDYDLEI